MKNSLFEKELMVVLGDTDAAGRIYFAKPAQWFHQVWEEYLDLRGLPISKILTGDFHLPVVNYEIQFKAPLQTGDKVQILLASVEFGERSFTVNYQAVDRVDSGKVFINGKISHVCVDMNGRPMTLPEKFISALN